jgi:hypothetical protein
MKYIILLIFAFMLLSCNRQERVQTIEISLPQSVSINEKIDSSASYPVLYKKLICSPTGSADIFYEVSFYKIKIDSCTFIMWGNNEGLQMLPLCSKVQQNNYYSTITKPVITNHRIRKKHINKSVTKK